MFGLDPLLTNHFKFCISGMSLARNCFAVLFAILLFQLTSTVLTQQAKADIARAPSVCRVRHSFIKVRYANCLTRNLALPLCSGYCFSMDNWKTSRPCNCCKPTKTRCTTVDLKCYDAKRSLVIKRYRIQYTTACSCTPCHDPHKYSGIDNSDV